MRRRRKRTFWLITNMIICMVATTLLLTSSINCIDCDEKLSGRYYTTEFHDPMCLSCSDEYYEDSEIDMDRYQQDVNNSLRNILLAGEAVLFIFAIVCVNIRKRKKSPSSMAGYTVGPDNKKRSVIERSSIARSDRDYVPRTDITRYPDARVNRARTVSSAPDRKPSRSADYNEYFKSGGDL